MNTRSICSLCLLLLLLSTAAHARIVFDSTRDGVEGVYVMDDDGSNQTLLTDKFNARIPSWSPDGTQVLFNRSVRGSTVLCLMNPDGTNIRELTERDGSYINRASFSPDGKFIVYSRITEIDNRGKYSIEVLNIKTGKREVISDMLVTCCDWSPDGKHIIFTESLSPGNNGTVWIMGVDERKPRRLIPAAIGAVSVHRWCPRWSPDGNQIAFYQEEFGHQPIAGRGNVRINKGNKLMICNRNGTNVRQLQIPKDRDFLSVDWMDDGKSIVFSARVGIPLNKPVPGDFDWSIGNIYKYDIKTHVVTQLTDHPGLDETVDWISDDVLPVAPQDKKKVTWGTLKQ